MRSVVYRFWAAAAAAVIAMSCGAAIGGCGDSPGETALRVTVSFSEQWSLDQLVVQVADHTETVAVTRELYFLVPSEWDGQQVTVVVTGLRGGEQVARGSASTQVVAGHELALQVTLAALPCGSWCTEGERSCREGGVSICEQRADNCMAWSDPVPCPSELPYCSLGVCGSDCVDECASGNTRCDGPEAFSLCGNADADPCLEWLPSVACGDGTSCSNGTCAVACTSECDDGQTRCVTGGVSTCGDLNGDDCWEWGPAQACPDEQSCSEGVCSDTCTDECTATVCTELMFSECGDFDFDSCLDLSAGVSCVSADPCLEGSCSPETGCSTSPVVCDAPPPGECVDDDTWRGYDEEGSCGELGCTYSWRDVQCPNCPACDACVGVSCDMPPMPQVCYQPSGTCTEGSCSYEYDDGAGCSDGDECTTGDHCDSGACLGTEVSCDMAPPPECLDERVLRTFYSPGSCTDGGCDYTHGDMTCGHSCADGVCRVANADLVVVAPSLVGVAVSSGAGFENMATWLSVGVDSHLDAPRFHVADVDGDDRADLISVNKQSVAVRLSSGTLFDSATTWHTDGASSHLDAPRFQFADVNADGRADLIYVGNNQVSVGLSTGTGFATTTQWLGSGVSSHQDVPRYHCADVNADGRADLIAVEETRVRVGISTGISFGGLGQWLPQGTSNQLDAPRSHVIDVDGDGRADLVIVGETSLNVGLSDGIEFATPTQWASWGVDYYGDAWRAKLGDVTGDGRADLVYVGEQRIKVAPSTGAAFGPRTDWLTYGATSYLDAPRYHVADTSGPQ